MNAPPLPPRAADEGPTPPVIVAVESVSPATEKDFGAGYAYPVIVLDAGIVK